MASAALPVAEQRTDSWNQFYTLFSLLVIHTHPLNLPMLLSRSRSVMQPTYTLKQGHASGHATQLRKQFMWSTNSPRWSLACLRHRHPACMAAGISSQRRSWLTVTNSCFLNSCDSLGVVGLSRSPCNAVSSALRAILLHVWTIWLPLLRSLPLAPSLFHWYS